MMGSLNLWTPAQVAEFAKHNGVSKQSAKRAKDLLKKLPDWPPNLRYIDHTTTPSFTCICEDTCDDDECDEACVCGSCMRKKYDLTPWRRWQRPDIFGTLFVSVYANGQGPYSIAHRHRLDYEMCSPEELKQFVKFRGLRDPYPSGLTLKAMYVKILDEADREATFRFLDLPAEMRNLVYAELLTFNVDTCPGHRFCYAQILRTCKAVNQEAISILYEDNVFDARFTVIAADEVPAAMVTDAMIHKQAVRVSGLTDHGKIDKGVALYPAFYRRITNLKIALLLLDEDDYEWHEAINRSSEYLRNCLLTLASFLMDQHRLRHVEIDIRGIDQLEDDTLTGILYPLRRLRNVSRVSVTGDYPTELVKTIVSDMQSSDISTTSNTLLRMQLLKAHGQAAVALHHATRPQYPYCSLEGREAPRYKGFHVIDAIEHHLEWIDVQISEPQANLWLCENAEEEKKLQIRLAKIQEALSCLDANKIRHKLSRLEKAQEAKEKYFKGRDDVKETKKLAEARSPSPHYEGMW